MLKKLQNKTVLVTGAGSGIGRAVAIEAAKSGATVILVSKTLKKLEHVYDEIMTYHHQDPHCPEPVIHPMNLLTITPQDAQKMAKGIETSFGCLHAVIHCAGIVGQLSPIEQYPAHLWQEVIHLNLTMPFLLTQACLPLLKVTPFSKIILTSADEGHQAKAYFGAYTCSKFGIQALSQVLTQELENTSIEVHTINPKKVRTALRAKIYPSEDPSTLASPQEIATDYISLLTK